MLSPRNLLDLDPADSECGEKEERDNKDDPGIVHGERMESLNFDV